MKPVLLFKIAAAQDLLQKHIQIIKLQKKYQYFKADGRETHFLELTHKHNLGSLLNCPTDKEMNKCDPQPRNES